MKDKPGHGTSPSVSWQASLIPKRLFVFVLFSLALFTALPASATTITVTNTNDSGLGSLRAAIATASWGDTIKFRLTYPATITLSSPLEIGSPLPLPVATNLKIKGPGATKLAISGSGSNGGVFRITEYAFGGPTTVDISGVTIENGGTIGDGGGIYNDGTLTLSGVTIENCSIFGDGGGIYNNGTLTLTDSTVSGNSNAHGEGGGIYNNGTLTLSDSTVSGNQANFSGGGISNLGTLTITNSTVSGNLGYFGGGIYNSNNGALTIANSTVSGNSALYFGGGIYNDGPSLTIANSTVSGNSGAAHGGGISGISYTIKNTIVANNVTGAGSGGNCGLFGGTTSDGHNLSDDYSCFAQFTGTGDLNNTPAGLDPAGLKNNGGPTKTIALLPTSAAVDAVPVRHHTNYCTLPNGTTPVATDQRGFLRPAGPACDIGAFELHGREAGPGFPHNECQEPRENSGRDSLDHSCDTEGHDQQRRGVKEDRPNWR